MATSPPTPGLRKLVRNPFFILGLTPEASRAQIEREGQKLLSMLQVGFGEASHYHTPLGPQRRTAEMVRHAMAELRDPSRRLCHEVWAAYCPPPDDCAKPVGSHTPDQPDPWEGAFASFGWRMS